MSELITTRTRADMRLHLLASVSALSLLIAATSQAKAEDADRPTVWIELGGQLERMTDNNQSYVPSFLPKFSSDSFTSVGSVQDPLGYSNGAQGKLLFRPNGADWVFTASLRYGRSNGKKASYQRLPRTTFVTINATRVERTAYGTPPRHLNATAENVERQLVVDFSAGKDVGLGMFGEHSPTAFSLGVRFAQFTSSSKIGINGVPDFTEIGRDFKYTGIFQSHHRYAGTLNVERSFHGIGPSLSLDGSTRMLGHGDDAEVTVDWGINGAVLFGRQKATGGTLATGSHYKTFSRVKKDFTSTKYNGVASAYHHAGDINRTHSVIVPNVGGFAGLSYRYSNAKLSLGYRADFFFGAMDGGIDTRKTYDRNFFGPYASISVGLGG